MVAIHTQYYQEVADRHFIEKARLYGMTDEEWEAWRNTKVEITQGELNDLSFGLHYGCEQIREQRERIDSLQEKLANPDNVESMEAALQLHYKCVVKPVNEYCDAFFNWEKAIAEKAQWLRDEEIPRLSSDEFDWALGQAEQDLKNWEEVLDHLRALKLPIVKSSFLRRHVYGREELRTEKCPIHKGSWCGIVRPSRGCPCETPDGELTGWIPKESV